MRPFEEDWQLKEGLIVTTIDGHDVLVGGEDMEPADRALAAKAPKMARLLLDTLRGTVQMDWAQQVAEALMEAGVLK
jgi:hypothetical protein